MAYHERQLCNTVYVFNRAETHINTNMQEASSNNKRLSISLPEHYYNTLMLDYYKFNNQ